MKKAKTNKTNEETQFLKYCSVCGCAFMTHWLEEDICLDCKKLEKK